MTYATPIDVYSIGLRDGDLKLRNLVVNGWGTTAAIVRTKTDNGRLWGRITAANVFELWSTPVFTDSAKRVAFSGTIAATGAITFAQDNTSGISGTAHVVYTLGTQQLFDVILTYASEEDLLLKYKGARSELDTDGKLDGLDIGFEAILKQTKLELDGWLWERYGPDREDLLEADADGRPDLSAITSPRQLAEVHAMLTASELYLRRAALDPESNAARTAESFRRMAKAKFDSLNVALDLERDGEVDHQQGITHTLERG